MYSPEDVLELKSPTKGFLCPLSANIYGIEFQQFIISNYQTKETIFLVNKDNPLPIKPTVSYDENSYRKIRYDFSEDVLRLPLLETSLTFSVGNHELEHFRMIELHYFRDELIKSYDFTFGFCIPNSVNTWDSVYSLPPIPDHLIDAIITHPYETTSDSFYFVKNQLIMHNKAEYRYIREDNAEEKKSYLRQYDSKDSKEYKNVQQSKESASYKWSKEEDYKDSK